VFPSLTLGAGGVGGSITGDNVTTYHLFNVKRLAYEIASPPPAAFSAGSAPQEASAFEIEQVVRSVVQEILSLKIKN